MSEKPSKTELIQKILESHNWIKSIVSKLPTEQLTTPGVQGERSVKDIIAHITAWNINGTEWIASIANDERPVLPMEGRPIEERPARFVELNKKIHEKNLNKSVEQVMDEFEEALENLLNQIKELENKQLETAFDFEWIEKQIHAWQIVAWRYYHCQSHGKHIESWLSNHLV